MILLDFTQGIRKINNLKHNSLISLLQNLHHNKMMLLVLANEIISLHPLFFTPFSSKMADYFK